MLDIILRNVAVMPMGALIMLSISLTALLLSLISLIYISIPDILYLKRYTISRPRKRKIKEQEKLKEKVTENWSMGSNDIEFNSKYLNKWRDIKDIMRSRRLLNGA